MARGRAPVLTGPWGRRTLSVEKLARADLLARDLRGSSMLFAGEGAPLDVVVVDLGRLRDASTAMFDERASTAAASPVFSRPRRWRGARRAGSSWDRI